MDYKKKKGFSQKGDASKSHGPTNVIALRRAEITYYVIHSQAFDYLQHKTLE